MTDAGASVTECILLGDLMLFPAPVAKLGQQGCQGQDEGWHGWQKNFDEVCARHRGVLGA